MTISRNNIWASRIALWEDVVKKSPDKPRAHLNLGGMYYAANRIRDAMREYQHVLDLKPDMYAAQANIALAQIDLGQKAEAERSLLHLIQAAPNYVVGYL